MINEKTIYENTKKVFENPSEINCIKADQNGKKIYVNAYMANGDIIRLSKDVNKLVFDFKETFAFIREILQDDAFKFALIQSADGIVNKNNITKIYSLSADKDDSFVMALFKGKQTVRLLTTKTKKVNGVVDRLSKGLKLNNDLEK